MKTALVLTLASSLLLPGVSTASDTHDADRGLESNLRRELNDKHVHVHVHEGIVTVDGKVPTDADRERVESIVRNTPGVVALKDELKVTLPPRASTACHPLVWSFRIPPFRSTRLPSPRWCRLRQW